MIIYMATNEMNGRSYIGATMRTLSKRQGEHRRGAARIIAGKRTCRAFHRAIAKYGWGAFSWRVVSRCSSLDELMVEEARLIRELKPYYNISCGGYGGGVRGLDGQSNLSLLQKPVRCINDGTTYKSMSEAALAYGVRMSLISAAMYRGGKCRGRSFEFLDRSHAVQRGHSYERLPRGVIFRADKKANQWQARVWVSGKARTLGFYATPEDAHAAHIAEQDRLGVYEIPKKGNKSGYRGVSTHNGSWRATIRIAGKRHYLGSFSTPEGARDAIAEARRVAPQDVRRKSVSRPNRGSSAPLKGVEKLSSGRWRAKHARKHLGVFDTPEEAHKVYLEAKGVFDGL